MSYKELSEILTEVEGSIAITSYGNPDPDAIASAYALGKIFEHKGLDYEILFGTNINRPENQLFVKYLDLEIKQIKRVSLSQYKHVSLVDWNPSRIKEVGDEPLLQELEEKLLTVQDHHSIDDTEVECLRKKDAYIDIRPTLGACSTILAECISESELSFDEKTATALYYGLYSDTNSFLRSFVREDFQQVINYVDQIDLEALARIIGTDMTSETFEIIHRVTDTDLYEVRGTYKFASAGRLNSKTRSAVPQVADLFIREEGINGIVIAGIDMDEKLIIGSVRYSGSRFTAEEIAEKIANGDGTGGGHLEMGGFQVRPGVLTDTLERQQTQEALLNGVKERFFSIVGKQPD